MRADNIKRGYKSRSRRVKYFQRCFIKIISYKAQKKCSKLSSKNMREKPMRESEEKRRGEKTEGCGECQCVAVFECESFLCLCPECKQAGSARLSTLFPFRHPDIHQMLVSVGFCNFAVVFHFYSPCCLLFFTN